MTHDINSSATPKALMGSIVFSTPFRQPPNVRLYVSIYSIACSAVDDDFGAISPHPGRR